MLIAFHFSIGSTLYQTVVLARYLIAPGPTALSEVSLIWYRGSRIQALHDNSHLL